MRTTLDLPEDLVERARRAAGTRTKRETVIQGLKGILHDRACARLLALRGKVDFPIEARDLRSRRRG